MRACGAAAARRRSAAAAAALAPRQRHLAERESRRHRVHHRHHLHRRLRHQPVSYTHLRAHETLMNL
eukprot:1945041-Prymnesium_polylepis.2